MQRVRSQDRQEVRMPASQDRKRLEFDSRYDLQRCIGSQLARERILVSNRMPAESKSSRMERPLMQLR